MLLNLLYQKVTNKKIPVKINLSPPKELLKSFGGYLSIVRFLIEDFNMDVHALDGSTNGKSVTYLSAFHGKMDVVKYLLEIPKKYILVVIFLSK